MDQELKTLLRKLDREVGEIKILLTTALEEQDEQWLAHEVLRKEVQDVRVSNGATSGQVKAIVALGLMQILYSLFK